MRDRIPPHDLNAERSVLGAVLLDASAMADVAPILTLADFYRSSHAVMYGGMWAMWSEGREIDVTTLRDFLRQSGALEKAGGEDALHDLATEFFTASNADHYARIVRDHSIRRKVIQAGIEMARAGYDAGEPAEDLLDAAAARLLSMDRTRDREPQALAEMIGGMMRRWEANEKPRPGVSTPLSDLNALLGGWRPGELVVIAGRPSMGKSSLAMNFVSHAATVEGRSSAIFSLEMTADQIAEGLLASDAGVNPRQFREGLASDDWPKLTASASRYDSGATIWIDDASRVTTVGIRSGLRRLCAKDPDLSLVVVDYLQLMEGSGKRENRQQEIAEISRTLKVLAREFKVTVLAVSQLSRAVENRNPPKPRMSDLRESGSLEQDADVVLLIYREDYYDREADTKGTAEIEVAKHRSGPTGTVTAVWLPHHLRFRDAAKNYSFPV